MGLTYRPAAAVVPYRNDELLCGLRGLGARSFKGYLVFPGGTVEDDDGDIPVLLPKAMTHTTPAHIACALRELAEETGRFLVVKTGGQAATSKQKDRFFTRLKEGQHLRQALLDMDFCFDGRELQFVGAVRSPDYGEVRFEVHQFFLNDCPKPQMPMQDELTQVQWRSVEVIDKGWREGQFAYLPPILRVMNALTLFAGASRVPEAIKWLQQNDADSIECREVLAGLCVQAYQTPTLPPATRTNTFLLGTKELYIVDPATPYGPEQERFDKLMTRLLAEGKTLKAVVLSHHHSDHVGDAQRVATKWSLPIWGHQLTAEKLDLTFDRYLDEGDVLGSWTLLHTPGHAPGHFCFWQAEQRSLVAADMVAEDSTIIIEPHDGGELKTYMESLKRLIALQPRTLTPSHGHLRTDGTALLEHTLSHRQKRVEQIKRHLEDAPHPLTPRNLVEEIYVGEVPEAIYPLAELSVVSSLLFLLAKGEVTEEKSLWSLRS
jgi:endoribonuclease LACTB2